MMFPPAGVIQQQGGWTPAALVGLYTWQEVGDIADFYQDSIKTTPVTTNGDLIGAAIDKSGNGRDMLQATSGNRPTYQTTYIQSNLNDYLTHTSWAVPNNLMAGIRFRYDTTTQNYGIWSVATSANSSFPAMLITANTTNFRVYVDGNYRWNLTSSPNVWNTVVMRVTKPSANYLFDVWHNGSKQTQYDGGTTWTNQQTSNIYWMTGFSQGGTNRHAGHVVASGVYSDAEAVLLSDYLTGLAA